MRNEKITTQRLADIKALIGYLTEEIEKLNKINRQEQLDNMGNATMTIMTTLIDIQKQIKHTEDIIDNNLKTLSDEGLSQIEDMLENVKLEVNKTNKGQNTNLDKIKDLYFDYTKNFEHLMKTIKEADKDASSKRDKIHDRLNHFNDKIDRVDKNIIKKEDFKESINNIKTQLEDLIQHEESTTSNQLSKMEAINNNLDDTKILINQTNKNLTDINASYEESTARLAVVNSKVDQMINLLVNNQE